MKCKNCGVDYDDNLLQCPYCRTFNKEGKRRSIIKNAKLTNYQKEKTKAIIEGKELATLKSLNKIMLVLLSVSLTSIAILFLTFYIRASILEHRDYTDIDQQFSDLRASEKYSRIDNAISGYDGYRTELTSEFLQISLLNSDILNFRSKVLELKDASSEELLSKDYKIKYLLSAADSLLKYQYEDRKISSYQQIKSGNATIYTQLIDEVNHTLTLYFHLTPEDIETIFSVDRSDYSDFITLVIERTKAYETH